MGVRVVAAALALLLTVAGCAAPPPTSTGVPVPAAPDASPTAAGPSPTPAPPTAQPASPAAPTTPSLAGTTSPGRATASPIPPTAGVASSPAAPTLVRVGDTTAREVVPGPDGRALYLSTGAELYRAVGAAPPALDVRVAIPPTLVALDGERLVGGAAPACARGGGGAALRYSRDGGKSWQPARAPAEATPWLARGDEVLALGCGGVLASDDGGATFARVAELSPANLEPRDLVLAPDGATAYLAAVSEGGSLRVLRAERAAGRWSTAVPIVDGWGAAALVLGGDGTLYVATAVDVSSSADRGRTWRSLKAGLEAELLGADPGRGPLGEADQRKLREGVGVDDLAVVGPALVAATRHGLYRRVGEAAWQRLPAPSGRVTRLRVAGSVVYASTAEGVWRVGA
jgi:hypothetical protein